MCSCPSTTVVRIHSSGSYCADAQQGRLTEALDELGTLDTYADAEAAASEALDALRKEPAPVPDDITLLNQAQAAIFRALCDARQAPPVWWSPTHGLIEVAHKVSPDDERLVRVADRRVIELPGDAIELRPVPAPVVDREGLIDFLVDLYLTQLDVDSAPQGWPRLTAEALISAGLVRTVAGETQ
jgi:hypothetical protein